MPTEKPHQSTLKDTQKRPRRGRNWRPFEEARALARSLGLKSKPAWIAWAQSGARPADIPATPPYAYAGKGWVSWGDWFGTRNRRGGWRSFEEARALVRSLGLRTQTAWETWTRGEARPADIPCSPQDVYRDKGWAGWDDWLGQGRYRSFEEARALARSLGLAGQVAWWAWCKSGARPVDIPINAPFVYRDKGWVNWSDWLGTRRKRGGWRPFEEARALARSLGLKSSTAWRSWVKSDACPADIPVSPGWVYRNQGWAGWGDWLGHGVKAERSGGFVFAPPN